MTTGGGAGGGSVDNVYINLMARLEALERDLARAENLSGSAGERAGGRFARAFEASAQIAGVLAGIGAALLGAASGAVVLAAKAEQSAAAFETLLGSGEKAKAFLADLSQFAAQTPFELTGLQDASRKLLAFGFTAEQILPMMRSIGDAVGALGGGAAEISRVTMALGQMQAKGKVSAEEMMQLAELGLPVWDMLAQKIGVTVPEAMKMAENGAISAGQAIPALLEGMSDRFGGAMERQATTLMGLWSNLSDNVTMTATALGNKLVEALNLKDVAGGLIETMGNIKAAIESGGLEQALAQWQPAIVAVAGALAGALAPALYGAAAGALALMAPLLPFIAAGAAIALAMNAAGVSLADVGAAMRSAGQWVADLATRLDAQYSITERLTPIIGKLGEVARAALALIGSAWENILKPVFLALAPLLGGAVAIAAELFSGFLDGLKSLFAAFSALFAGDWAGFLARIVDAVKGIGAGLLKAWEVAFKAGRDALEKVGPLILTALESLGLKVMEAVRQLRPRFELAMTYAAEGLVIALKALMPDWFTYGQQIADNLIAGIRGRRDALQQELADMAVTDAANAKPAGGGATIQGAAALAAAATGGRATQTQAYGVNAGQNGYGPGGHNGVDFRVGAQGANADDSIYAPFAGTATIKNDKWTGKTVEITDALGQKIILGHLSAFSKDLQAAIAVGKGKALVAAGQFLGREGNTGNSTAPHLHIGARNAQGREVDPNTLRFQSVTGSPTPTKPQTGTTPPPAPAAPKPAPAPSIADVFTGSGGAQAAAAQAATRAADQLAAKLKTLKEGFILGKVAGSAYTGQLSAIEKAAKDAALSAADPKTRTAYVGIYQDAQAAAQSYATASKKAAAAPVTEIKGQRDALAELSARYAYVGESGKAAYKSGLSAFIASQDKIIKGSKSGSAEQVAAMQNVARARQLLADADKKATREMTDAERGRAAIADAQANKARDAALRAASPAELAAKGAKAKAAGDLALWSAIQSEIERRQADADQRADRRDQGREQIAAQKAAQTREAALRAASPAQLAAKSKKAEADGDLALWSAIEREIERRASVADQADTRRKQERERADREAAQNAAEATRKQIAGLKDLSLEKLKGLALDTATLKNADLLAAVTDEITRRGMEAAKGNAAAVADLADARADAAEAEVKRLEANLARELEAVRDNAAARLQLQEELGGAILEAQRSAIDKRQAAETAAEVARYEKAKADAEKNGGDLEALRVAHEARLSNIAGRFLAQRTAAEDAAGRATASARKALSDQLTRDAADAAADWTEEQLANLDRLTGAERAHVRETLEIERAKYQALGKEGEGAVNKIEAALGRLSKSEQKAAADLADLLAEADPSEGYRADIAAADPKRKETAAGAVAQATAGYSRVIERINADLKALGDAYAKRNPAEITPAEAKAYAARKAILEGLLADAQKASEAAGKVAAIEFDQKALDDAASLRLQLAELNLTLDEAAGQAETGRERYAAALVAYRDYWAARVQILKAEGGPAYLAALQNLANAEQKIGQDTAAQSLRDAQDNADAAAGAVADIEARYAKLSADQGALTLRQKNAQLSASLTAREAVLRANYARDVTAAGNDARKKKALEDQLQRDLTKLAADGANERRALLYEGLDAVKAWSGAIGEIASKVSGNDAFKGIADGIGSAVDAFKSFSSGDIVGGIMAAFSAIESLGTAILNLSPGFQAWRKGLLDVMEVQNKALSGGNTGLIGNPFEAALKADAASRERLANAGFWQRVGWALFGGAPEVMENAAGEALAKIKTIFDGLADGLSDTLKDALLEGFKLGDFSKVGDRLKKAMQDNVIKVIIDETLKAALAAAGMADKLKNMAELIAEAIKTGDWGRVSAAMKDAYDAGMNAVNQVTPVLAGLPGYGSEPATPQDASNALPDSVVSYAVAPAAVMAAPTWAVDWSNAAKEHAAALRESTPVLERIASEGLYTRVEVAGKIEGATLMDLAADLLRTGRLG